MKKVAVEVVIDWRGNNKSFEAFRDQLKDAAREVVVASGNPGEYEIFTKIGVTLKELA
jgi:hypothetical protein